ncbi:uncharacterized protein LOC112595045 [Melanaphis sacchari]|uniref:uncharacterized protein LOC112595045 n=1 Tax=Melanaphis sacchari TaxID=742174 RepID=UPI000DC132DF|nr:uncharacterized protein LOC112595045 [Melanaphis sacchari]
MKFVLIVFLFICLQYETSQYEINSQIYRPYHNRYLQAMYSYPQTDTVYTRSVYRNVIPEIRSNIIPKKPINVEPNPSQPNDILSKLKFIMILLRYNQDHSTTDESSKKVQDDPNAETYKGKSTKKTLASFRSASV